MMSSYTQANQTIWDEVPNKSINVEWDTVYSAEVCKHAVNMFLKNEYVNLLSLDQRKGNYYCHLK